ncbi:GlsB/YeaQ/YmgE family stress response membrane protein [Telluribacter sp. SYSU D00476]|uniref:GlsB/YeaQ/YmgE family stress response membrane protein n=1 Tax=Telluribacter sp. SYSU D00476 TaxID=2811430 RepID=UPI001FF55C82|nr:GlsB/YeaQ/YmgE family stress response membrane protein [Telluribacter sp. SYSU D00476]
MGILTWILVGLVAGFIAKAIHPGKDPGGFIVTILIGIGGAIIGGFVSSLFGFGTVDGFNFGSLVIAILGAVILLWVYRRFSTRRV